ncbi:MAG: hypothetical protein RKR03_07475, partial [Candidatus Competibacter sp.]|nr:hypothetical protein [Candidatus Competibacter sp.]
SDFIFALQRGGGMERLVVLEMKGPQLAGNLDTECKQAVLQLLSDHYAIERAPYVGGLELVVSDGTTVQCDLVIMQGWKVRFPNEFVSGWLIPASGKHPMIERRGGRTKFGRGWAGRASSMAPAGESPRGCASKPTNTRLAPPFVWAMFGQNRSFQRAKKTTWQFSAKPLD